MRQAYDKPEFREEYRQPKEYSRVLNDWERRRIIDEWAVID
jgi:hypothetical protein